jgi:cysteine desulfurase
MAQTRIYLDYAATTPVRPEVVDAMAPWFSESFGNPSSLYELGQRSKAAVEDARERVARAIGAADSTEIVFTGGGTESDNHCLVGAAEANEAKGKHLITTAFEHHAVLEPLEHMERRGWELTLIEPPSDGIITPELVASAMRPDTSLVSVMWVNNEVGTVQPIADIARAVKGRGAIMHADAVQALGKVPIDVSDAPVDLLSFSAHKLYGPKGVGATFVRKGTELEPYLRGGGQERRLRSGTQNVPGIVGFGLAAELAVAEMPDEQIRLRALRERLLEGLLARVPHMYLNADRDRRIAGNINFIVRAIEGESLLLLLDQQGLAISVGSACSSGSTKPSHVLLALGVPEEDAHGSVRIVLGKWSTDEHVDTVLEVFPPVVERLREMSPVWHDMCRADEVAG